MMANMMMPVMMPQQNAMMGQMPGMPFNPFMMNNFMSQMNPMMMGGFMMPGMQSMAQMPNEDINMGGLPNEVMDLM